MAAMEEMEPARGSSDARQIELSRLPDRFFNNVDDVLTQELEDLDHPWNLGMIEERIQEYSKFSEEINAQLSARVMRNYNDFVQGMQHVQAVETELTLIGVLVKNGRRKLQERDLGLVRGSMHITKQQRKSERLARLLTTLRDFQGVAEIDMQLRQCVSAENYCEAIRHHAALREALAREQFKQFPGLLGLREGLTVHMADVRQKLSDGLRVAAVSQEFDAERYEDILKAYSMMSPDQALSVGKELLNHVTKCIEIVSKQCMLIFAVPPGSASPADWHSKAQISDICRDMDPTQFVACTAQLYEHLCDFLYRHQFLCQWHVCRQAAPDQGEDERFRQVLREVLSELSGSKRNVWERCAQEVQLVLMTLNFQYPALTEDSFLHILHLTHLLIDEGDAFMAGSQMSGQQGTMPEDRRHYSRPIRNTLRSKAHDYFQSLHYHAWVDFKVCHLEQDSWQRVVVPRNYRLIRHDRLRQVLPRKESAWTGEPSLQKLRTAENNPFRNYKAEPLLPTASADTSEDIVGVGKGEAGDEFDEHALLQHWIDDNENTLLEQIGSSMLSNSNRSPVVSSSTVELARVLERYFRMMGAIPQLAVEIFESAGQVIEFYVHCILCLFVQDRHLRMFLDDLETPIQPGLPSSEQKLQSRHETFILQRLCPDLRRAILRTRDLMSSITLPESCAAALGAQGPVSGVSLLQVRTSPNLSSPSALCGLAERCVGVESVCSLLNDLRDLRQWLSTLVPRGGPQEGVERFLPQQEVIASQLRMFVLMSAARDVLEVPDVGRISLEHFSNTVQGLKWDVKDFKDGSPAQPYLEQLRAQIDELARRIPCAGGGSIPHATQRTVWNWIQVRILHECVEVVAKIGKKKSQEALFRLAEDFKTLQNMSAQQNFKVAGSEKEQALLPDGHPLAKTVAWEYLDEYLTAHGHALSDSKFNPVVWCKNNPQYPLRLLKALVEYLPSNPKVQKQMLFDLEVFVASHISEEYFIATSTASFMKATA